MGPISQPEYQMVLQQLLKSAHLISGQLVLTKQALRALLRNFRTYTYSPSHKTDMGEYLAAMVQLRYNIQTTVECNFETDSIIRISQPHCEEALLPCLLPNRFSEVHKSSRSSIQESIVTTTSVGDYSKAIYTPVTSEEDFATKDPTTRIAVLTLSLSLSR